MRGWKDSKNHSNQKENLEAYLIVKRVFFFLFFKRGELINNAYGGDALKRKMEKLNGVKGGRDKKIWEGR